MSDQLSTFDHRAPVRTSRADELDEEAADFLRDHPDVWRLFTEYAFALIRSGRSHGVAKMIVERIRWEHATSAHGGEPVLNNSHVASFARIFAATYPAHADFFRFRERTSARRAA